MSINDERYLQIVRGFGLYHMIASLPLALPVVSGFTLSLFGTIHQALNLSGAWPAFDPTTLLFVNLFATLATAWGYFRFKYPSQEIGRIEGIAMILFALIVIWYVAQGASPLWLFIAIVDSIGAYLHLKHPNNQM